MKTKNVYLNKKVYERMKLELTKEKILIELKVEKTKQTIENLKKNILEKVNKKEFELFSNQGDIAFDTKRDLFWYLGNYTVNANGSTCSYSITVSKLNSWNLCDLNFLQQMSTNSNFRAVSKISNGNPVYSTQTYSSYRYYCTWGSNSTSYTNGNYYILVWHNLKKDFISDILDNNFIPSSAQVEFESLKENLESLKKLLPELKEKEENVSSIQKMLFFKNYFLKKDNTQCKLPIIGEKELTDHNAGLWELYIPESQKQYYQGFELSEEWEMRKPEEEVKQSSVAIDFGTSSTVVSFRDETGKTKLLRVGVSDLSKAATQKDYENPTILQIKDYKKFMETFKEEFFRPYTNWDDAMCSHEAFEVLKDNIDNSDKIGSILTAIKRWALTSIDKNKTVRFKDLEKNEFEVKPLTKDEKYNINQNKFEIEPNYEFDPVEIYAYFLGLFINMRKRIFLKYYMTFPVSYPKKVKTKILASFYKGLLRSLPVGIIDSLLFKKFCVEEIAQEPAAYAACAIKELNLVNKSNKEIHYSVFDFGGGTTDFDYGLYRESTEDEYNNEGWEYVIERFASSGDNFLGGENIIENLSYIVFKQNIEICRKEKITFTKPQNSDDFPGSEAFIYDTSIAKTNTAIVMKEMRNIWENFEKYQTGKDSKHKFKLISTGKEKGEEREFLINYSDLNKYIAERIFNGIFNFFTAMKEVYEDRKKQPEAIHILLGGNSCKSTLVQAMFSKLLSPQTQEKGSKEQAKENKAETTKTNIDEFNKIVEQTKTLKELFPNWTLPKFILHKPLEADEKDPYKPTGKTGIAVGLLRLLPGEPLHLIEPKHAKKEEAPFAYYVGKYKRDVFEAIFERNDSLKGVEYFGVTINNAMVIVYTTSPQAVNGNLQRGNIALKETTLNFDKKYVYGKIIGPNEIEVASFDNQSDTNNKELLGKANWIKVKLS